MRLILSVLCGVMAATTLVQAEPTKGQNSPEAVEVLRQVESAMAGVETVRFRAMSVPGGAAVSFLAPAEGTAVMSGWEATVGMPARFWAHITTKKRGTDELVELTGGGDGDTYFIVDHTTKKAYADMDPSVLGSSRMILQNFGIATFVEEQPMQAEMDAESIELGDPEKISGEECYRVEVAYGGDQGRATWFFAKSDYLPRRRIQYFSMGPQEGSLETTLTDLVVNPEVKPGQFRLELPKGFEQIDDFAP